MKIKLKGSLQTEKTTLNVLLAVGIIAFFISLIIEIPIQKWMCSLIYRKLHLAYISNVMLGAAASSVISYISLYFSFINKKNNQINSVVIILREIYEDYKNIYITVRYKATSNEKENKYYLEKHILERVKKLEKKISSVSAMYENSEFSSESISKIIAVLQNEVECNLSYITTFCETLLLDLIYSPEARERYSKQNPFFPDSLSKASIKWDIEMGNLPRDIITKRAEKDCYQFLLKTINLNNSIDQMNMLFKSMEVELKWEDFVTALNKTSDSIRKWVNIKNQVVTQTCIRFTISEIQSRHREKYFSEECELSDRMSEAMKKVGDTLAKSSCLTSKYEQFNKLLQEDKFEEAKKILREVEQGGPFE